MNAWRAKVPLGDGEDLVSFCRRMAIVSGSPTLGGFLTDIGTTMLQVVHGTDDAVRIAAEFGQADVDRLRAATVMRVLGDSAHARGYRFNGHPVAQGHVERSVMRFCPLCLAEDQARWPNLHEAAPFIRGEWQLKWMRACPVHAVALVADGKWPAIGQDFGSLAENVVPLPPSGMETYLRHRATAKPTSGSEWLEGLHLNSIADFCESVGLIVKMEHEVAADKVKVRKLSIYSLSPAERHAAGDMGWQILSQGPEMLKHLVERFTAMACARGGIMKPGGILGPLNFYLSMRPNDKALQGIRDMIRTVIAASTPINPSTQIFGVKVDASSMTSLHVMAKATGMHYKRLGKLLILGGAISHGERVFRVDERTNALVREIAETMSLKQAGVYINASRVQMVLLVRSGILQASAVGGDGRNAERSFAKRDLDEFLARLTKDQKMIKGGVGTMAQSGLATIPFAARKARCSAVDIVRLIFEGRICIATDQDDYGYMSVYVSPADIRGILYGSRTGLSLHEVAKQRGWGENFVTFLVNESFLAFEVVENPITRLKQRMVKPESLREFDEKYILIDEFIGQFRRHHVDVRKEISRLGVKPVRDSGIGSRIYERSNGAGWAAIKIRALLDYEASRAQHN
ncbi:hypothetical protein AZA_64291 [Nitrospirillum viridazoti Y2]|uniref:TniQ protein n=1 Tax=Nitrospirillum amazonense TaxID=28077 RepID=A0A560IYY9_9PROT|nr:TniQ family protein [Nitrospirillum amazonense]EGY02042.1 hypothetical protein AZA_64291 [Nitrospirillum amazonense Y2]TWB64232.1 TniQ protein [Nitrospirillum amazonense]